MVNKKNNAISTIVGRFSGIEGTLGFQGMVRIDGRVQGKIVGKDGFLIIGADGIVEGDIFVGEAVIMGMVTGMIHANKSIRVQAPARITGDMKAPEISIDPGVIFEGFCQTG